jgi:hypothetical protein
MTTARVLGMAKENSCPAAAWQVIFRMAQWVPKTRAVVKGQEAGKQTEVRGSAQKDANMLNCQKVKIYLSNRYL